MNEHENVQTEIIADPWWGGFCGRNWVQPPF